MDVNRALIVGAGLTGATAALTLRQEGFEGEVLVVGAEPHLPYNRPPLSKTFLRSEEGREEILVQPREAYSDAGIQLRLGTRVASVRPAQREVELEGGETISYTSLVIATGVRNRMLPLQARPLERVYSLRSLDDSERLKSEAVPGRRAAVIGLGFIGSEVTASLRQLGVEVTAIEPSPTPLHRVVGDEVGAVLADIHREHGVELILGDLPEELEGETAVTGVRTRSGRLVPADFVVIGVGTQPNVEFLAGSEVEMDNGILVDEYLRTNVDGIFAAGDVANHHNPLFGRRMRVEHWNNAEWQGRAVALSVLGKASPFDVVPNFWSDQYDHSLEYRGHHTDWDEVVVRGSLESKSFLAFFVKDGRVPAALALNRAQEIDQAEALIRGRVAVDRERLADQRVEIAALASC